MRTLAAERVDLAHSLDSSYGLIGTSGGGLVACPARRGLAILDPYTGQVWPARCCQLRCPVCGPCEAYRSSLAIGVSGPRRLITFTQVGLTWEEAHHRMGHALRFLARRGCKGEWAWGVHPGVFPTENHIHAYQHGPAPDLDCLWAAAEAAGMGAIVDCREIWDAVGAQGYLLKAMNNSPRTSSSLSQDATDYLNLNNGRLLHNTRNFFRDAEGRPTGGLRKAKEALRSATGAPSDLVLIDQRDLREGYEAPWTR